MILSELISKLMKVKEAFGDGEVWIGMKNNYGNCDRHESVGSLIIDSSQGDTDPVLVTLIPATKTT